MDITNGNHTQNVTPYGGPYAEEMDIDPDVQNSNPEPTQHQTSSKEREENERDSDSDVWASDSSQEPQPRQKPSRILSDLPAIRRVHHKQGYREGILAGKSNPETAQAGFDEGYPLGARIGLRCGWVLGVLEGLRGLGVLEEGVLKEARAELDMASLMRGMVDMGMISTEGEGEGEWKDVEIDEIEALKKWEQYARELEERYGLKK